MEGTIVVETASWADPGFVADWYPPGLGAARRLEFYAQRFRGVEVNSTFHAVPPPETVQGWVDRTPSWFTFDVKLPAPLSRHATPVDRLPTDLRSLARTSDRGRVRLAPDLEAALARRLLEAIEPLERAGRLSALLLALSPSFSPHAHSLAELDGLLELLAPRPVAIEVRHRGWLSPLRVESTLDALSERGVALVGVDAPRGRSVTMLPPVDAVTSGDLAYLRAHGRNARGWVRGRTVAERFGWDYSEGELAQIAERACGLAARVPSVRLAFNNNRSADAPRAARRMRELLGQDPGPPPEEALGGAAVSAGGRR